MLDLQTYQAFRDNPALYRANLIVDVNGTARKLGDVLDAWQEQDYASIDPAMQQAAGTIPYDPSTKSRSYFERPRGHSKTTDLAVTVCWMLAFATRPLRGYAYAADQGQAALLRDAISTLCRLNPWLGAMVKVQNWNIKNTATKHPGNGTTLEIATSDVATSYGINPDFIIADELTHWKGEGELWHSITSSAAKRERCFLAVITNAGFADSWQWLVREAARQETGWVFSRLDGPQATWMTPARLQEQRRMLPEIAYLRLWENQWSSGGGDALRQDDIDAAFHPDMGPITGKAPGWIFVGGVDLGLKRDFTSVVVLAVPKNQWGKVRLAHHKTWKPQEQAGGKVNLSEVEHHLLELDKTYGLEQVGFDPWQADLLASRIEANGGRRRRNQRRVNWAEPFMVEQPPTASNLRDQANLTIECFTDRRLELYECAPLRYDLQRLRAEETSYGMRLTSPRDGNGHGDTYSAFALALTIAHAQNAKRPVRVGVLKSQTQKEYDRMQRMNEHLEWLQDNNDAYSNQMR